MYLPSHLLVGVNSISDLKKVLEYTNKNGVYCYAVLGYDGCIPDCLVAWIKFTKIPYQFVNLLNKYNIENILTISIYDKDNESIGENISRLLYRKNSDLKKDNCIEEDIYLLYIHEIYTKSNKTDNEIFKNLLFDMKDFNFSDFSTQPICKYITDWESGIDNPIELYTDANKLIPVFINAKSTVDLYQIAYHLGKEFIKLNNITKQGIVLNPYFINNPLYELCYGYLPVLYWQGNTQNKTIIENLLKDDIKTTDLIWYNLFTNQSPPIYINCKLITLYNDVNNESDLMQTTQWILKYKQQKYSYKPLSFYHLMYILKFICKF